MAEHRCVAVFAVGNESRGDDALGPLLLERLEQRFGAGVRAFRDFQFQVEHALDLIGADIALFIDAEQGLETPFRFRELAPARDLEIFSHALSPASILGVFERVLRQAPPPAFALGVAGSRFGLGEPLSPQAAAALDVAFTFAGELVQDPDPVRWRALARDREAGSDEPARDDGDQSLSFGKNSAR